MTIQIQLLRGISAAMYCGPAFTDGSERRRLEVRYLSGMVEDYPLPTPVADAISILAAQREALLEALKTAQRIINHAPPGGVPEQEREDWLRSARAAITAVKGEA